MTYQTYSSAPTQHSSDSMKMIPTLLAFFFGILIGANSACSKETEPKNAGWNIPGVKEDKYAKAYVDSPIFWKLGVESPVRPNCSYAIRVSRLSSWGANVVEVEVNDQQIVVNGYTCGANEASSLFRFGSHTTRILKGKEAEEFARSINFSELRNWAKNFVKDENDENYSIADGVSIFIEFYDTTGWDAAFISNKQISAHAKTVPPALLNGALRAIQTNPD